jgi:Fe-Mn family superoxide dismutase
MTYELPKLPYSYEALEPYISARALMLHHDGHHKAYADKFNTLAEGTPFAKMKLLDVILATAGNMKLAPIFQNAAQAWNHEFFWKCMLAPGDDGPSPALRSRLKECFGGFPDNFRQAFKDAAMTRFGSGWVWLTVDRFGELHVESTANADSPINEGRVPLLTCDVWEHAYYLDYQNRRGAFVDAFLEHLINWEFVSTCHSLAEQTDWSKRWPLVQAMGGQPIGGQAMGAH